MQLIDRNPKFHADFQFLFDKKGSIKLLLQKSYIATLSSF